MKIELSRERSRLRESRVLKEGWREEISSKHKTNIKNKKSNEQIFKFSHLTQLLVLVGDPGNEKI